MRRRMVLGVSTILVLALAATVLFSAQEITGTILGTVRDISGGTIADATITITNEGTGVSRTINSDTNGDYIVNLLPVGTYTVKIERQGFATYRRELCSRSTRTLAWTPRSSPARCSSR